MKRIEDKSSRQVTFSKRRSGLIKKARELSVLCDVEVALIVFSRSGRLYEFCSTGSSRLSKVLNRYQDGGASQTTTMSNEVENLHLDYTDVEMCTELVKTVDRFLDGPDIQQLSLDEFAQLERQLDAALLETRTRKNQLMEESMTTLQEQERMLREENEQLKEEVATLKDKEKNGTHITLGLNGQEDAKLDLPRPQETLPLLLKLT